MGARWQNQKMSKKMSKRNRQNQSKRKEKPNWQKNPNNQAFILKRFSVAVARVVWTAFQQNAVDYSWRMYIDSGSAGVWHANQPKVYPDL
jgi:hypothetical protein